MTKPRFLLLEDNLSDVERIQTLLTNGGVDHELLRVDTCADFVTALETETFDLILAAYAIPGFEDGAALKVTLTLRPDIPFIFVSAKLGEELAIAALKRGATDYVLKHRLERLLPSVQQALQESRERQAAPRQYAHAETLLQASHDTFRQLVENSPFGIYVVNADFRLVQVSAGAQKVFENVRPLIGRDFAEVLHIIWSEPFASEAIALFRQTLETGEPYHAPSTIERRYDIREVESSDWKIERITLPDGRFGVVCHFYDLSERQHYEAALRESEEQSRNILESITDAFFAVDKDWHFTYVNQTTGNLLNRAPADLIGKNLWEEYPGLIGSEFERIYLDAMHDRVAGSLTQFYPNHNRWYEARTYPTSTGIAVYFRNVTDQIQAEAALRQSEARFRRIFECNMVPIAVWTMTGGITQANDALLDMIGYTRSELESGQINWQALTPPECRALDEIALNEIATKGVSAPYEKVYVCKDGRQIPILIGAASFLDDANSGVFFAIDLTDRKQAKAALQESEELYRTLFESIDQGFCLLEILFDANDKAYDYRYLETNEAFEEQSGLTNAVGKTIIELVPDLEPQWAECYEQVVKLREAIRFEANVPSMNRVFDIYAVPSGAPSQNLVSLLFTDITERKRREANLAFLAEVQDDCARFTTAEDIMQTVGEKIGAYLNLVICAFVDVDEAQDQALMTYCWHRADVPNLVGTYRISNFVNEEFYIAARAGVVVIVNDTNTDARTNAASFAALGVQSFIHVPLLRDGQWKFLFNVYDSRARNWREDEIELFSELANRIFQSLERARAEAALRNSEERFRLMANVVPTIVWISDAEGRIEFFNQQWSDYTGVPYESATAAGVVARFAHPEDGDRTMAAFNEARRCGGIFSVEHRIRSAAGTYRWFIVRAESYRDPQTREIVRWFGASMDIHDRKIAEQEREQILAREQAARETAENANRIKDEFLAVLSHELRSPLNPILGWTRLLQNGKLDESRRTEALKTIERNAKLQTQLIEDLLDISRIMQGKLSLTANPTSLTYVISAAIETVRLAAEAKNIEITLDLDPAIAPISGDAARLQQVVWNLLTNAVKFTPNGGQVTVDLRQLDHLAQIRVIDTGKGINPQFLPHVFEYFRQEDGSTTRKFGGLGLGLAIVRQIVEMHGGTVRAESQGENQGATFIVQLPVLSRATSIAPEPTHPRTNIEAPLDGIQILLVDDKTDTREFQAFLLEQSGAKVTAVASGLEALQTLEQSIPDVLVSDVGMADMDGYMLIGLLRERPPNRGGAIPAIALTAYAAEVDRLRAIEAGFEAFITKPVEPETLVKAIITLLNGNQQ